jgi:hypothetical protein
VQFSFVASLDGSPPGVYCSSRVPAQHQRALDRFDQHDRANAHSGNDPNTKVV